MNVLTVLQILRKEWQRANEEIGRSNNDLTIYYYRGRADQCQLLIEMLTKNRGDNGKE